eukprot:3746157-Prymnesium_polylepis.1
MPRSHYIQRASRRALLVRRRLHGRWGQPGQLPAGMAVPATTTGTVVLVAEMRTRLPPMPWPRMK